MAHWHVNVTLVVDDELLADHVIESDGAKPPYSEDLEQWDFDDVLRAVDLEIIDPGDCIIGLVYKDDRLEEPPTPYGAPEPEGRTLFYAPVSPTLGHVRCSWEQGPRKHVVSRAGARELALAWEAAFVEAES